MGHIEKRQRNGMLRWRVRYLGPDRRERNKTFRTKAEAERYLIKAEAAKLDGSWLPPERGRVKFAKVAEDWIATPKIRSLKARTVKGYEGILATRVLPEFGDLRVSSIREEDLERWVGRMLDEGLSASRVHNCFNVVGAVLDHAVRRGYAIRNVARTVDGLPPRRSAQRIFLDADQVERLAEAMVPRFQALICLFAYGGLRWGEAAALRRRHVNLLYRRVEVQSAIEELGNRLVEGTPKNHQQRVVYLPEFAWSRLETHLSEWVDDDPDALLFGTANGTPYWNSDFRRRYFRPAVEKAGLPRGLTPHGLRHSCASLWRDAGARVEQVQRQLGHANPTVTRNVYVHMFDDRPDDVLEALDRRHGPAEPPTAQRRPQGDRGTSRRRGRRTGTEP